jgi:hypothetical protein
LLKTHWSGGEPRRECEVEFWFRETIEAPKRPKQEKVVDLMAALRESAGMGARKSTPTRAQTLAPA